MEILSDMKTLDFQSNLCLTIFFFFSPQVQDLRKPAYVVFKDVVRTEGVSALYNGLKPTLIRTVPATSTLFLTYEYSKKLMNSYLDD